MDLIWGMVYFNTVANIVTLSIILTFGVYHLFIYSGRKNFPQQRYNLFFSIFSLGLFGIVFINTYHIIFSTKVNPTTIPWMPLLESSLALITQIGAMGFLSILNGSYNKKYYKYPTVFISIAVLLSTIRLISTGVFYSNYIYPIAIGFVTISILSMFFILFLPVFRNKSTLTKPNRIILYTSLSIIAYIVFERILSVFQIFTLEYFYLPVSVAVFTYSYGLANTFNQEYTELRVLKNELNDIVNEKTKELKDAINALKESNELKSKFYTQIAHETKTPLTLIKNYFDRYISKNKKSKELLIIQDNINKMVEDINNLMNIEKLEQQGVIYDNNQVCNVSEILGKKKVLLQETASVNLLTLDIETQEDCYIMSDPTAIECVINNLFDNAIKYTSDNGSISIVLRKTEENVFLVVEDTGIGIEKSIQDKIFQPYFQNFSDKASHKGLGMGLYIVNTIVKSLSASIEVTSKPNRGSCFKVKFPLVKNDCSKLKKNENIIPNDSQSNYNLLLVEDNLSLLNYLADEFKDEYNVEVARNGEEALKKIKHYFQPDLIISDIMMPGINGEGLYQKLNSNSDTRAIPIIFLTARNSTIDKINQLNSGVLDYIAKPFSIDELKAKAYSVLLNRSNQEEYIVSQAKDAISNFLMNRRNDKNSIISHFEEKANEFNITKRQKEIILLISQGYEYKDIAAKLFLSPKTINRHIQILYQKLNINNKIELLNCFFN